MTKYQARLYFLYPFLLAVFSYFYNIFFDFNFFIDKTFFFFLVVFLSGVISFTHERKNTLSEIIAIAGSIIIFSLILLISRDFTVAFLSVLKMITVSTFYHILMFVAFFIIYSFFEWIFKKELIE
ncbi:hypothetical protein C4565_04625 [Candidatus Parcubacteria bacterium]|jgi:hypothetical protein|nr:MAG: hypothetical protein C4565_04625 [Candidatus Parcubacteria bacterium]